MHLNEKSKDEPLSACPNLKCNVSTFIKVSTCPACGATGLFVRHPLDDRGMPTARPVA